ncbi:hypothetical protein FEE95_04790 [Maribacter algarum]|uniref:Uncharacterized protein n=1 Tax=Maribacter algarum (ex Zhang et al. 2020) TaxID=2578118 RepID=A0A5S3PWZ6_9FLAO|nr:hypothetical protein [Maribacter algarum]TMM58752.1 hypothetical protein FEE95_04790 [Maribacter algarum]
MKTNFFLIGIFLLFLLTNLSCDVDEIIDELDGNCDEAWTVQVKPELDALNKAASIFQNDPTIPTCESFRAAALNYVEAMEEVEACVLGEQRQAFDTALEDAKAELQKGSCAELIN